MYKNAQKFRRGRWRKDKGVERNLARKKIRMRTERVVVALLSLSLAPCSPGAALCVLPTQAGRQVPRFVIPCAHSTPEPFIDVFRFAERRLSPRAHILPVCTWRRLGKRATTYYCTPFTRKGNLTSRTITCVTCYVLPWDVYRVLPSYVRKEQTLTQQQVNIIFRSSTFSPFTLHDKFVTCDDEWMYTFGQATQVASCEQVHVWMELVRRMQ
jgi:hypothetical protein